MKDVSDKWFYCSIELDMLTTKIFGWEGQGIVRGETRKLYYS